MQSTTQPVVKKQSLALINLTDEIALHYSEFLRFKNETVANGHSAISEAINTGKLLNRAKSLLPHGRFVKYVVDNFPFSHSTANRLMEVAANSSLLTSFKDTKSLTQAYQTIGVLPLPKKANPISEGTGSVDLAAEGAAKLVKASKAVSGIADAIGDIEKISTEARKEILKFTASVVKLNEDLKRIDDE